MYEAQLIEVEDYSFGHYINHFDEVDENNLTYNEMYECVDSVLNCIEEYEW